MPRRTTIVSLMAALLLVAGGAGCPQVLDQYTIREPRPWPAQPSLTDVAAALEQHAARVESFSSTKASIRGTGMPGVSANIAYQAPRRFRMIAETGLTGAELDLGSNDELFWFWVRRSDPPAMFFCRHEQFAASRARQMLPIEPQWLVESLGIVRLDPLLVHEGPRQAGENRLAIMTSVPRPEGEWTKVTILDARHGWVLEQHLSDPGGQLIASALASEHRRDAVTEVTLPRRIELKWPAAGFDLELRLNNLVINYADEFTPELWAMPEGTAERYLDLGDPNSWARPEEGHPAAVRFGEAAP